MPAQLPAPGVARFAITQTMAGRTCENIYHVIKQEAVTAYTLAELTSIATAFGTWHKTSVLPLQSNYVTLTGVVGLDLGSSSGLSVSVPETGVGTASGTALPASVAACLSWSQGVHYRGGHPRTYIMGLSTVDIASANTLTGSYMSSLQAAGNTLITNISAISGIGGGPAALCCLHRTLGKVTLNPPQAGIIFGASVFARIDSQRRRLGKETV